MRQIRAATVLVGLLFTLSCGKKQIAENNQCYGAKPFVGDLIISQEVGDTLIQADTIFLNSYLRFTPVGNSIDSMKWQIGLNNPFIRNSEVRQFISGNLNESIRVGLTLFRKPNAKCFPNDSSINYYEKTFFVTDISKSLVKGTFKGYLVENPSDTFSIYIRYYNSPLPYYFLANLPKGCTRSAYMAGSPLEIGYPINVGYKSFHIEGGTCIPNIFGNGILLSNDSLKIRYWYYDSLNTNTKIYRTFSGKRIS